jgi:hypothetical protein
LTKSGFVYVISNIGSFGEKVVKIGMTRRMEPMERIQELGDASVPFPFDLHVMLYSDNAPQLEGALHDLFEDRRVNMVNARKEFYRDVELAEVKRSSSNAASAPSSLPLRKRRNIEKPLPYETAARGRIRLSRRWSVSSQHSLQRAQLLLVLIEVVSACGRLPKAVEGESARTNSQL